MKKLWIALIAPPAIVLFVWLFGELVMHLWNWLLPALFGWRSITFWQALGLVLLCRILFGSWSSGDRGKGRRRRRWESMTPEEREKLRHDWGVRCGLAGAGESKEPA
jgi:hypothetical protein